MKIGVGQVTQSAKIELIGMFLQNLKQGEYEKFRQYLIKNEIIQLNLQDKANDLDLAYLSLALQGTQVTHLNLSFNEINADSIAKLKLQGTKVTHLELGFNNIGADGIAKLHLQDTEVVYLGLWGNNIGADGLGMLNLQRTKVTKLNLGDNNLGANGGLAKLYLPGTKITELILASNDLDAGDLKSLYLQDTQVVHLDLGYNHISALALKNLSLQGTQVINLNLMHNAIGDDDVESLHLQGTQVVYLDLRGNNIGINGAVKLAQKIPGTLLFSVTIDGQYDVLQQALKANSQAVIGKPYIVMEESYLRQELSNNVARTLWRLREAGVHELQDKIFGYLPEMMITTQYNTEKMQMSKMLQKLAAVKIVEIAETKKNKLAEKSALK